MTECDILIYLFAAFSVAGCGWIFIAARIRQRYIDEIKHLKESNDVYERLFKNMSEEIQCEERRFSDLWEQFAALAKAKQELAEALEEFIRNPAGDNTEKNAIAILAKHKEQA